MFEVHRSATSDEMQDEQKWGTQWERGDSLLLTDTSLARLSRTMKTSVSIASK